MDSAPGSRRASVVVSYECREISKLTTICVLSAMLQFRASYLFVFFLFSFFLVFAPTSYTPCHMIYLACTTIIIEKYIIYHSYMYLQHYSSTTVVLLSCPTRAWLRKIISLFACFGAGAAGIEHSSLHMQCSFRSNDSLAIAATVSIVLIIALMT